MQTLKFKTNIKCSGCVNAIKPFMDSVKEISSWKVNLESSDKIVEVITKEVSNNKLSGKIISGIKQARYSAELI